jgi:hypothetical protein
VDPALFGLEDERLKGDETVCPVSFAVHCESADVKSLYLCPVRLEAVADSLPLRDSDEVIVLSGGGPAVSEWGRAIEGGFWIYPVHRLGDLVSPVEIADFAPGTDPTVLAAKAFEPILARPELALPHEIGTRFAWTVDETGHGVLLSRDDAVITGVLRAFLEALQVARVGQDAELPELDAGLLAPLTEPVDDAAYHDVQFRTRRRHWLLEFRTAWAGLWETDGDTLRWVSEGEQGRWRAGWSW